MVSRFLVEELGHLLFVSIDQRYPLAASVHWERVFLGAIPAGDILGREESHSGGGIDREVVLERERERQEERLRRRAAGSGPSSSAAFGGALLTLWWTNFLSFFHSNKTVLAVCIAVLSLYSSA